MDEIVSKPNLEDEDKQEIGQRLGVIKSKYPNARALADANVKITITVFEPTNKSGSKGILKEITGKIERVDFEMNRFVIDGQRFKLKDIVHVELPASLQQDEYSFDDGSSDGTTQKVQMSERERRELEEQIQAMKEKQIKEYKHQQQQEEERKKAKWEMRERERYRRGGDTYDGDIDYNDYGSQEVKYGSERQQEPNYYTDDPAPDYGDDMTDYATMGDYIPDENSYIDGPVKGEKTRDVNEEEENKKKKKDNWRLAYLPPKKKKDKSSSDADSKSKKSKGKKKSSE